MEHNNKIKEAMSRLNEAFEELSKEALKVQAAIKVFIETAHSFDKNKIVVARLKRVV